MLRTPVSIVLSRSLVSQSVLVMAHHQLQKSLVVGGGGGTVKITSAPGPDHLMIRLNWNRLERLKIDLELTRNGPGLDLDLDLSLTTSHFSHKP